MNVTIFILAVTVFITGLVLRFTAEHQRLSTGLSLFLCMVSVVLICLSVIAGIAAAVSGGA